MTITEISQSTLLGESVLNIAVLGASGRTGVQVVAYALAQGHSVTAVVRHPESFAPRHPRLQTVIANVMSAAGLQGALDAADAVCSVLGSTEPRRDTTLYSGSMAALLAAMPQAGPRRVIAVTAMPVQPQALSSVGERLVVHPLLNVFFGGAYRDMARMETLLSASGVDWTVLRPPRLTDGPATGRYRTAVDARLAGATKLARADLARALLDAINEPSFIRHAVSVAA
jgi:putative NADH-flavin reductase